MMRGLLGAWCAGVVALGAGAPLAAPATRVDEPRPVMRVTEAADGDIVRLEVAVREMRGPEGAPTVYLAGAIHVAQPEFYAGLQGFLDGLDVVLFEGVKPAGSGRPEDDVEVPQDHETRAKATRRRLRFLAVAAEEYHHRNGAYPSSIDELRAGLETRLATLVAGSTTDAWGGALRLVPAPEAERPDFVSLGADGAPGGEGPASDLRFSDQKPLSKAERGAEDGIQQKMAKALGLTFQLDQMDHDKPHWRNSDLAIDQVQDRLDRAGADSGMIFQMLDGSSIQARLAGLVLRLIGASDTMRAMARLMIVELSARADALFGALPEDMAALMDVLLKDRNAVVVADLRAILRAEPGLARVGIIYGAGHLPDLERRLVQELGYTPGEDTWRTAIEVDLAAVGIDAAQGRQMREMFRRTIEMQLGQLKTAR